ncbi:cation:dicarboxylate symporter family transporter [Roseiconus lacunae]|uniref:cation:dicarboxylate symporter family transporter n=1 Tax=Roseiconus lacunae TaxID=2605694 RepID=UPI001E37B151|nr:cation:dicarboxylase symporter family transporter [Roseiconus lacunae]MCD0462924.1 cation:dicarboxylase symporter family transporter [Roseiconus lacunae]
MKRSQTIQPTGTAGQRIMIGLGAGVLLGLFFGEALAGLEVFGQAYVGLLQMTVLPYLVVSIIAKVGRLKVAQTKELGLAAFAVLILFVVLGISLIVGFAGLLPPTEGAAFFSSASEPASVGWQSLLTQFIPTNVFHSLAEGYVPGIVVFCLFFGGAMMLTPDKESLLDLLEICSAGLSHVNRFLVKLAPIGLFALTAAAAGTLRFEELVRLQAYLIMYAMASIVTAYVVLPAIVCNLTSIRYHDFVHAIQEPVLIAIATGKLVVTLPLIIEKCDGLLMQNAGRDQSSPDATASVLVPLAYPFPHLGKMLTFTFIVFAAWYSGKELSFLETLQVATLGAIFSFASPLVTIPYLLDQYQLPQDLMSLFVLPGFITMRLGDVVGVVHLMALSTIVSEYSRRSLCVRWNRLMPSLAGGLICIAAMIAGGRLYLTSTTLRYDLDQQFLALEIQSPHENVIVHAAADELPEQERSQRSTLERIIESGTCRVGFLPDAMPYCFFNSRQHLVGLDVELMHRLAKRLEIRLEFVPCSHETFLQRLASNEIDIAIGGVLLLPERLAKVGLTQPYRTATLAVVTQDHRRGEFGSWENFKNDPEVHLGANHIDVAKSIKRNLGPLRVEVIEPPKQYFTGDRPEIDGMVMAAEIGAVWNILYPNHTVVIPTPRIRRPVSFVVRSEDRAWLKLLDRWIDFERLDGSLDQLEIYWIQGGGTKTKPPRWSVIDDVLGWTN